MVQPDPFLPDMLSRHICDAAETWSGLRVIGLCGAQGSGKSTLAQALARRLNVAGLPCAVISLDDLYLSRAERMVLAETVHPLFATRGVPGTHDIALGLETIAALDRGESVPLPRFDKAKDDRVSADQWPAAPRGTRVLILEGWCLGALPQSDSALIAPVNQLEAEEDREGIWREYANAALAGPYQGLFMWIHELNLLAAPCWDVVAQWREEAEAELRCTGAPQAMTTTEVARFILHYERLTRWILAEMPARADFTFRLDKDRELLSID